MLLGRLLRLLVLRPGISYIAIAMSDVDVDSMRDVGWTVVERNRKDVPSTTSSFPAQQLVLPISAFAQRTDPHFRQLEVYRIPV